MIVVVDYGLGNVGSVGNMLRRLGERSVLSADPGAIASATGLVIPGVGHFDEGMRKLRARGLVEPLRKRVIEERTPVLGICLGLQLMARSSEEGSEPGLGWLDADVKRFDFGAGRSLPIPHMGWGTVERANDVLVRDLDPERARFYFVHSYHLVCDRSSDVVAWCEYGYRFAAAVHRGNLFGTQFHPEKSHRHGMALLQNFVGVCQGAR